MKLLRCYNYFYRKMVCMLLMNTNCFVSQIYFVASELRPTVVFDFVFKWPHGSHSRLLPGVSF